MELDIKKKEAIKSLQSEIALMKSMIKHIRTGDKDLCFGAIVTASCINRFFSEKLPAQIQDALGSH